MQMRLLMDENVKVRIRFRVNHKHFRSTSFSVYRIMKLLSGELIPSVMILGMPIALPEMCKCSRTGVNVLPTVGGDSVWSESDGVPSSGDSRMLLVQPSLWTTDHPEILSVFAVMNAPPVRLAVFQSFLCSFTPHIIHPNGACGRCYRLQKH